LTISKPFIHAVLRVGLINPHYEACVIFTTCKKLGRPKGVLVKSKLDGRGDEIRRLLALDVSKASIAEITGVDRSTLYNFIGSRGSLQIPNLAR